MGWAIDERALAKDQLDPLLADPSRPAHRALRARARASEGQCERPAPAAPCGRDRRPVALQAALLPQPEAAQDLRRRGREPRATRRRPGSTRSQQGREPGLDARPTSRGPARIATRSSTGGSAENPLKARWMGIVGGVGIHGTSAEYSIGTAASHGCIRMRVADVIDLYHEVPVGSRGTHPLTRLHPRARPRDERVRAQFDTNVFGSPGRHPHDSRGNAQAGWAGS